jgi:RNA polymerase sigma factor (sigma-70 family)
MRRSHDAATPVARADWEADQLFAKQAINGDENAARLLQSRYEGKLKAVLYQRGASSGVAGDIVADLWADCFGSSGKSLLSKYQGRCALGSWLITVATNRLIDFKRRETLRTEIRDGRVVTPAPESLDNRGDSPQYRRDDALLALLRGAISHGFASQRPEILVMLRLVHVYEITQREIGRIWKWPEYKVSRVLNSARTHIKSAVLDELRRTDPWLKLEWDDFRELATYASDLIIHGQSEIEVQNRSAP